MYQTIIVPLDGSPRSQAALAPAAKLASACGAAFHLIRVYTTDRPDLDDDPSWDDMFRSGERQYLTTLAMAYGPLAGGDVVTDLLDPPVVESICDYAEQCEAPLIVMTGRGHTGLRRALLGSVADGVVRKGTTPLLVLRDERGQARSWLSVGRPIGPVIVPLDGSVYAEGAIAHAVGLARATDATIHLLRVAGPNTGGSVLSAFAMHPLQPFEEAVVLRSDAALEYLKGVADRINAGGKTVDVTTEVVVSDHPARAIADRCRREDVGLVVMATHGRGGSRLVLGSVADRLLEIGLNALLFVRPTDRGALAAIEVKRGAEPVVRRVPVLVP